MSKSRDDGGPAFPLQEQMQPAIGNCNAWLSSGQTGMSLRDYFAAQAIKSTLSASASRDNCYDYAAAAVGAYQVADEMLAARRIAFGADEEDGIR